MIQKKTEHQNRLSYRLRDGIKYQLTVNSLSLILDYPLKILQINPIWQPAINLLDTPGFVQLEETLDLMKISTPQKAESFLNELVRKGFLESRGFREFDDYPFVSIIIPVRNRPQDIKDCLESLFKIDYPSNKMEIIVVDDASIDNTRDVIEEFDVKLISMEEQKQASYCRNLAAQEAKGEILAFIDSDCTADPKWLKVLVPAFDDSTIGVAGGMVDSIFDERGLDRYEKVKSSLSMGTWPKSSREGDQFFYVPSCNLLTRKKVFNDLGGFREDMHVGEDVDFCWRVRNLGLHIDYRPGGTIYHKHRNDIKGFCTRRFDYGTSEPLLQSMHKDRLKKLQFSFFDLLFWGTILLYILSGWEVLLGLCGAAILIDSNNKWKNVKRMDIPLGYPRILLVTLRGYIHFLYNLCSFCSRYYLFAAVPIFFLSPDSSVILICAHLITGTVEFIIKRPRLNLIIFLFYFSLEQLSYQAGVWRECFRNLNFQPVNPHLVMKNGLDAGH